MQTRACIICVCLCSETKETTTLLSIYMMVSFSKCTRLSFKFFNSKEIFDNLHLLVKNFTVWNLSGKLGIPKIKENVAHVRLGPIECNRCVVELWPS